MEFEWDENKRLANLAAHGIDFEDAIAIWEGPVLEVPSAQSGHGEDRLLAIGLCEDRVITVAFTWRARKRRLVSARAARKNERENYHKAIERAAEG
jgi:uncharacterized protein